MVCVIVEVICFQSMEELSDLATTLMKENSLYEDVRGDGEEEVEEEECPLTIVQDKGTSRIILHSPKQRKKKPVYENVDFEPPMRPKSKPNQELAKQKREEFLASGASANDHRKSLQELQLMSKVKSLQPAISEAAENSSENSSKSVAPPSDTGSLYSMVDNSEPRKTPAKNQKKSSAPGSPRKPIKLPERLSKSLDEVLSRPRQLTVSPKQLASGASNATRTSISERGQSHGTTPTGTVSIAIHLCLTL